ncbi:MAG: hypothetical protein FWG12_00510 [Holophagaceae bacterium]|nr:hypothetical protein [Holophagaceae bacterium]
MTLTTIIVATETGPPNSILPICMEKVLGDPILFWQLRAVPESVSQIFILAGSHHDEAISHLSNAGSEIEFQAKIECIGGSGLADSIQELSETLGADSETQILLLKSTQPLIGKKSIELLASTTGILVPEGQCDNLSPIVGPISLPLSILSSAVRALPKDFVFEDLVKQITIDTELERLYCDPDDFLEIHTRRDIVKMQEVTRARIVNYWLDAGVAFIEPSSAFVGPRAKISSSGVLIEPNVRLEGIVTLGEGATIGQGSIIRNSSLGPCTEVRPYCIIEGSDIGDRTRIGPFAHLREGSRIDSGASLGNFVETKKAHFGAGAKANHLSYLGDCEVGKGTNIGAGCITCNYDGFNKHKTIIGKDVFIGSDCQLVAPVAVGDRAILGAGTTLTSDAPKDSIVLTRPETTIRSGAAKALRARLKAKGKSTM